MSDVDEWYQAARLESYRSDPVAAAKAWLGDRYLLAQPVNKKERK